MARRASACVALALGCGALGCGALACGCGAPEGTVADARAPAETGALGATRGEPVEGGDEAALRPREDVPSGTGVPPARPAPSEPIGRPGEPIVPSGPIEPAAPSEPETAAPAPSYASDLCPVGIPGMTVRMERAARGGALVFTADPPFVDGIRERVSRFADLHGEASRARRGAADEGAPTFGDDEAWIHRASVRAEPSRDGVRLVVQAREAPHVEPLREELRADAADISRGACPLSFAIAK